MIRWLWNLICRLLAVAAIFAVILLLLAPIIGNDRAASFGLNGVVETRCISGVKYGIDRNGVAHRFVSEYGRGVRCDEEGL